jgi:hypothetical protein
MTSHRGMLREHSLDELDRVIRWALWERVSGSSPSPWECDRVRNRICGLVERRGVWHLMRRGVASGCWTVADQLSRIDAFLSGRMVWWIRPPGGWVEWRRDPRYTCLLDQYSFLFQLAF